MRSLPKLTLILLAHLAFASRLFAGDTPKPGPASKPAEPTTKVAHVEIKTLGRTLTLHLRHGKGGRQRVAIVVDNKDAETLLVEKDKNRPEVRDLPTVLKEFKASHATGSVLIHGDQELVFAELDKVLEEIAEADIRDTKYEVAERPSK